jgi:endonuclease/exonuclease/phosphatase family metal-dependent hydrolase
MKKTLLLLTIVISTTLYGQDQVNIMYYNLLNYPSSSPLRHDTLRKIVQYVKPDLFLVNELQSNQGANLILANSLNQFGINYYQKAAFIDGPDTDNMLFYNSTKFGLVSQKKIATVLRDINEYVLYYKDPTITALSDTIYFYMYSLHLKAGTSDEFQRNIECTTLRNYLDAKANIENVFVGGDFNFYTATEPGFSTIKTSTTLPLIDPIYATGNWHNNSAYAYLHTQSTRTSDLGDGSWGGMDDRFDFIFSTNDVMTGSKGIKYVANSYQALGQDGLRLNGSIINPPNNLVPDSVSIALMYMSDHLPVIMNVDVNYLTNSITKSSVNRIDLTYQSKFNRFKLTEKINSGHFTLYTLSGQKVMDVILDNTKVITINSLETGIYVWRIEENGTIFSNKVLLK